MLSHLQSALAYRAKWARLGVYYGKTFPRLDRVRIAGRTVRLSFPERERDVHEFEFGKIVFEDCYRLDRIAHPVRTVLDIGANIGLFAIAARRHFAHALIQCYEPNPALEPYLAAHCADIGALYNMEAVGSAPGRIALESDNDSLHSVSQLRSDGSIVQRSFSDAVAKLGNVDLVKLDCEGAEWDIFSDPAPWQQIRSIVMEYHLWARPDATTESVERCLQALGFGGITVEPSSNGPWGLAFAYRQSPV